MTTKRAYRLNADAVQAIRNLQQALREQSPDKPGTAEMLAFDPESDTTKPEVEAKFREMMGDIADRLGLAPDIAYAIRKTGLVVSDRGKHLLDDKQLAAWNQAIEEYVRMVKWQQ